MCRTQTHTVSGVIVLSTYFVCVYICFDSSIDLVKATDYLSRWASDFKRCQIHAFYHLASGDHQKWLQKDKKWLTVSLERRTKFWSGIRKFKQNGSNFLKLFERMQIAQLFTAHFQYHRHIQIWNLPRFPNEPKTQDSADHVTSHGFARRLISDITTSIFVFRQLFSEQSWRSHSVSRIGSLLLLISALVPRLKVWLTPVILKWVCQKKSHVYPCSRRRLVHAQRFPIILPAELDSSSYRKCWAEHNPRRHQTRLPPCPEAPVISLSLLCVKWKM